MIETIKFLDVPADEAIKTQIPGVTIYRGISLVTRQSFVYSPTICFLLQGKKVISLGGVAFPYGANKYLVVSVFLPMDVEVLGSIEEPVIGVVVDIEMAVLHELVSIMDSAWKFSDISNQIYPKAVQPAPMDEAMKNILDRMARCLKSDMEAQVLGSGLVREMMYHVLCGPQSSALYTLADKTHPFARIAHILESIQTKYSENLDIESLAKEANMSVTAFHQAFKQVTSESPMQYLKKIRLTEAKNLIIRKREKVYTAASAVGYKSTSQFSREFKRYFGKSPSEFAQGVCCK